MPDRPTVVIADSSEAFLMYVSILLQRLDFEVLPAGSGINALKMAKAIHPNLVILGMSIPEMNGLEILKAMRTEIDMKDIPAIMAGDSTEEEALCKEQGCQAFLLKPIELDQLHSALESCSIYPTSQRKFMRAPFPEKVSLAFNHKTYECQAVTLSEGGIYIRRKLPLPQGCLLDVSIPLGPNKTLLLEGEVIYTKQLSEDRFTMPPGMAIRFLMVNEQHAQILRGHITNLLIGDIIEEQEEPVIKG